MSNAKSTLLGISLRRQVILRSKKNHRSQSGELCFLIERGMQAETLARTEDGNLEGVKLPDSNTADGRMCWYPDLDLRQRFKDYSGPSGELDGLSDAKKARVLLVNGLIAEGYV